MSVYIYDTFDGALGSELSTHVGQQGAVWTRNPGGDANWTGTAYSSVHKLTGVGRVYGTVYSYKYTLYMASGEPDGLEYDIRVKVDILTSADSDNLYGAAFLMSPTTNSFWAVVYEGSFKRWALIPYTNGSRGTSAATWGDVQSGWPLTRNLDIRVRTGTPKISVLIDGVERLSTSLNIVAGHRIGFYQTGGAPGTDLTKMQYDQLSAGSIGYVLPTYEVSGPSQATPDAPSSNFTVSLSGGVNPGSIVVTPAVTGMAGVFTPTSVTLLDADRTKTFTFTPTGEGVATISFTNNIGAGNQVDMVLTAAFSPPNRLAYWHTTFGKFATGGVSPYRPGVTVAEGTGGYWLDGEDHYDPPECYYQTRDYANRKGITIPDQFREEILTGLIRLRDRAVRAYGAPGFANPGLSGSWDGRETQGVQSWHRYLGGIARHYLDTGDPADVAAADILCSLTEGDANTFSLPDTNIGIQRERSFWLTAMLDRASMGLGEHPQMDNCARNLLYFIDLWVEPYATKKYGIWLKPFMGSLTARALIHYWERYRDDARPDKAEVCGMIPGRIKSFSSYLMQTGGGGEPRLWYPAGTDWGNGWLEGSIAYRDFADADPKVVNIGPGNQVVSVQDPRRVVTGPASLSAVDDYYNHATIVIDGRADANTIVDYEGATRKITITNLYIFQSDVTTSDTFTIKPAGWNTGEGNVPSAGLNGMIFPIHAWAYWHERRVVGNYVGSLVYRQRAHDVWNGNSQSWDQAYAQKQWNQTQMWSPEGHQWLENGDYPWAVASGFTFEAPPSGSRGRVGLRATFRVQVPVGERLALPETITPVKSSGLASVSAPAPILSTVERVKGFTVIPAAGDSGTTITVSGAGETLPDSVALGLDVSPAFPARNPAVTVYTLAGPRQAAVGYTPTFAPFDQTKWFTVTIGDGVVGVSIRFTPQASAGTGTFEPAYFDITNTLRAAIFRYIPTSAGARTISFTNNAGIADAPGVPFQTDPYTPGAAVADYTVTGPAGGNVDEDSAAFTVTLGAGEIIGKTYRFLPYAGKGFEGLGDFFPRWFDLTNGRRTATFVYRPYTSGERAINFNDIPNMTDPAPALYAVSVPSAGDPVSAYSLAGPSVALVGVQSGSFTVTLGAGIVSGVIRFTPQASAGTGGFIPAYFDLSDSTRTGLFSLVATSVDGRDVSVSNNGGLPNASAISVTVTEPTESGPPPPDDTASSATYVAIASGGTTRRFLIKVD